MNSKHGSFGYKVGYILAIIAAFCLAAVIVGITAKFLFWLF